MDSGEMIGTERQGKRVMWAILALVICVPVINLKKMITEGIPPLFQNGDFNLAYAGGMFFSILLILVWYYAYKGRRRPRIALGLVYLMVAGILIGLPTLLFLFGTPIPPAWPVGLFIATVYGAAGWTLLFSANVKAFQRYQRNAPGLSTTG